jgi:ABC-type branched-subunit amino acid transport system substrate-binding protein
MLIGRIVYAAMCNTLRRRYRKEEWGKRWISHQFNPNCFDGIREGISLMRKLSLLLIIFVVVAAFTVPTLAQDDMGYPEWMNHSECSEDLSGQTITLWHIGDLSGAYAPITQPLIAAFADASAWYNSHGGFCGAELTFPDPTTIDTAGDQEQTSVIYSRVSSENPHILVLYASADSELLRDQLAADEIPVLISAGSVEGLYGGEADNYNAPGWVFATNPLYVDQIGDFCEYAGENIEAPVLGYISWPNAFGRAAFTPESVAFCESVGVAVVETPEFFAPGGDITGQIQNLLDAGANILYTNSLGTGPAEIAAAVTNMGARGDVTLAGVNWALDTSVGFLGLATSGPDGLPSVNGIIGSLPFRWWTETDQPGIQLITEQADVAERGPLVRNIAYLLGWQTVDLYLEAFIQTGNRVGFANIDGAAIKETLEGISFDPLGLFNINFQDGNRDAKLNRIAVMGYLGTNGGLASIPDNPPLVVEGSSGPILVPVVAPLTDFADTPDLRPGGMDVPSE